MSIFGSLRRRRGKMKEADAPVAASDGAETAGFADKDTERAAIAIQARHRGRQTRKKKGFVGELLSGANKVLESAASYAQGATVEVAKSAQRASVAIASAAINTNSLYTQDDIDAPTPPDRWFTPAAGWPQSVELTDDDRGPWKPPTALIPTAKDAPAFFAEGSRVAPPIGELKIEVLQAEGIPKMERCQKKVAMM